MTVGVGSVPLICPKFRHFFHVQCTISRPQIANVVMGGPMRDEELDLLHNAELKEAFDEFDKVKMVFLLCYCMIYTNLQIHEEHTHLHTHSAQCGAQGGFR